MYKLNKNSNLRSEIEERGRGQRLKVRSKRSLEHYSSYSNEDDILLKDKPVAYPTFPKKQKSKLNFLKNCNFILYFFLLLCLVYLSPCYS